MTEACAKCKVGLLTEAAFDSKYRGTAIGFIGDVHTQYLDYQARKQRDLNSVGVLCASRGGAFCASCMRSLAVPHPKEGGLACLNCGGHMIRFTGQNLMPAQSPAPRNSPRSPSFNVYFPSNANDKRPPQPSNQNPAESATLPQSPTLGVRFKTSDNQFASPARDHKISGWKVFWQCAHELFMLKNSSLFEIETATSEQEADSNFGIAIQVAHPDEIAALQKALLARTRFRRMAASPPFIEPPEIFRLAVKPAGFVTERGVLVNSLRNEMDWSTSMEIGWKAAGDRAVKAIAQPSPKEIGATCDKIESILTTHFQDAKLFWHDEGSVLLGEIGDELEERGGLLMMQDIYMHLLDRPIRKNLDVLEFAWRLSFSKLCVKPGYSL